MQGTWMGRMDRMKAGRWNRSGLHVDERNESSAPAGAIWKEDGGCEMGPGYHGLRDAQSGVAPPRGYSPASRWDAKEEGNKDGQDAQDEDGIALLEPEAEAPGPVKPRPSPQSTHSHEGPCASRAQPPPVPAINSANESTSTTPSLPSFMRVSAR